MFDAPNIFSVAFKLKATIPATLLPLIVAWYVKNFVYVPSVSSLLLLRISLHFFDYSCLSPMCLSSPNRSNSKACRHIMPYSAPLCKALHYSKTGVPWQIKSTRILMFSPPKKPYFAVICRVLPLSKMYKVLLQCHMTLNFSTYLGISRQNKANRYTHS